MRVSQVGGGGSSSALRLVLIFILLFLLPAYAIVGVGCFYDHPRYFGNIFNSSRTIFSLINGDSILEVFTELQTNADLGYIVREGGRGRALA